MELESVNNIPIISELAQDYRQKRNEARKALNKLQKQREKFYFLNRITQPRKSSDTKDDDVKLEIALQHLFESLNFQCKKPDDEADVDFRAKFKGLYLGVEVKNGNLVGENDTFQPFKHKLLHEDTFHPLLIYNNTKHNDSWGDERVKIALEMKFGLLLTTELRKGYFKLAKGQITFGQFLNQLNQTGEIKFSNKALEKAL